MSAAANPRWTLLAMGAQARLRVGADDDPAEVEADRVADQILRMPEPMIQRSCAGCAADPGAGLPAIQEEPAVRRRATTGGAGADLADDFGDRLGAGEPLDPASRAFFEPRFGRDLGDVRIHRDAQADAAATGIGALAFTLGSRVAFAAGQHQPASATGRRLLAHELTHVVQQRGRPASTVSRFRDSDVDKINPSSGVDPGYTWSKNCGWIDWSHVELKDEAADLIKRVRQASATMSGAGSGAAPADVATPTLESHPSGVVFDSASMRLRLLRALAGPDEELGVALGIWKKLSMAFEANQDWSDAFAHSSFSQEDLPSNLIAFYMAAKGYTRQQIAGTWRGGVQKDMSWNPFKKDMQWVGRDQSGGFCDAVDRSTSKSEYDGSPFVGNKNRSFTPVGATGAWPKELSLIVARDDLYEVIGTTLTNPSGAAKVCPLYRLEGRYFSAADDVSVVPTYRVKIGYWVLGVQPETRIEVEGSSKKDKAAFVTRGYASPMYVSTRDLVCLTSLGATPPP
jgi:hypothetical protein